MAQQQVESSVATKVEGPGFPDSATPPAAPGGAAPSDGVIRGPGRSPCRAARTHFTVLGIRATVSTDTALEDRSSVRVRNFRLE